MQYFIDAFESDFGYWIFLIGGIILVAFSCVMFYGIKKKGKVILLQAFLKNKQLDNDVFLGRYLIQAAYTFILGFALVVVTVFSILSRMNILILFCFIGVFDGVYDYFAIKKSIKK